MEFVVPVAMMVEFEGKLCRFCQHRLFSALHLVVLVWVQGVGVTEKAYPVEFTSCSVWSEGDASPRQIMKMRLKRNHTLNPA